MQARNAKHGTIRIYYSSEIAVGTSQLLVSVGVLDHYVQMGNCKCHVGFFEPNNTMFL